ncbi:MAG: hypothetical protein JWM04_720 [Verrucomicrobiales bacterium]|nr:hypothetical protein [Verrucomicrobiales bacterium]
MFPHRQVNIFLLRSLFICLTFFCVLDSTAITGTRLLQISPGYSILGNNHSTFPLTSFNGSTIAFESLANNLVPLPLTNKFIQIYASHPGTTQLDLVSSSSLNLPADKDSFLEDISRDGDVILFLSASTNLVLPTFTLGSTNLFVRVLSKNQTLLVSAPSDGATPAGISANGLLSPDGHSVYFESTSSNHSAATLPPSANYLYIRNILDSSTAILGTNFLSSDSSSSLFVRGNLSTNGHYASYGVISNNVASVVVQDLSLPSVHVVWSTNNSTNIVISNIQLSDDGQCLLFALSDISTARSTNFIADLQTDSITTLGSSEFLVQKGEKLAPRITPDGRFVLFSPDLGPLNWGFAIWDRTVGTNILSLKGTSGNLSSDGTLVTFLGYCQDFGFSGSRTNTQLFQIDLTAGSINILSLTTNGTPSSRDIAGLSVSGNGKMMAFQSPDGDLFPGDTNGVLDVFSFTIENPACQLVSRSPSLQPVTFFKPDVDIIGTVTISNKMWAVLNEKLQPFSPAETNTAFQLLLLEPESQTRILVTTNYSGKPFFGKIMSPVYSQDGTVFAFNTDSRDLITNKTSGISTNLFLFNRQTGEFTNLTANFSGTRYPLSAPSLTSDGSILAFVREDFETQFSRSNFLFFSHSGQSERFSNAIDIPPSISPDGSSVLYYTGNPLGLWLTNRTLHTSASFGNVQPTNVVFSADSRYLFFGRDNITAVNTSTFKTNFLNTGRPVAVSSNGMVLVFFGYYPFQQLYTWNLADLSITQIGQYLNNAHSVRQASITPDGRFVLFESESAFFPGVSLNDIQCRILLADRLTSTINLISESNGEQSSIGSAPKFGKDGSYILYRSSDFESSGFASHSSSTFYFLLGNTGFIDSDHDGLDDNWEIRMFGGLTHNGQEDSDGDGITDLDEFLAGTDPLDPTSNLKLVPFESLALGNLKWKSSFRKNYKVQFKDSLSSPIWLDLDLPIQVNGNQAQAYDRISYGINSRFYRVILVP